VKAMEYNKKYLKSFYRNERANEQGLYLSNIWNKEGKELLKDENYLKWLIPFDKTNNVLDRAMIEELKKDEIAIKNIEKSIDIYFRCFDMQVVSNHRLYIESVQNRREWIIDKELNNDNMRRMLVFLKALKFYELQNDLYAFLYELYQRQSDLIKPEVFSAWTKALMS
jgi:hypothetical protein